MSVMLVLVSQGSKATLRLRVDGDAEELPWEALHDGQEFLSLRVRFSRCVAAIRDIKDQAPGWEKSGVLIVGADSRGGLPDAASEATSIGSILSAGGVQNITVATGQEAQRSPVIKAHQSGRYDILHFSGHSVFDADHPFQSYLELTSGTRLFLHELGTLGRSRGEHNCLQLVFLNSCQSARVAEDKITGRHLSMCKTLREAGVGVVIGMLWNVEDDAAVQFGSGFYRALLENPGTGPEEAMRQTRNHVGIDRAWADGSWLALVLYT
jgi:CHAT domain-containing protein